MSWEKEIDQGANQLDRGEYKNAEATIQSALDKLKSNEAWQADYAQGLELIGRVRTLLGKLDQAQKDLDECRKIRERLHGANSKQVAMTDVYLVDVALAKEQFEPAYKLATAALAVIEKECNGNDLAIADAATRAGRAAGFLQKFDESENMLNRALGIRRGNLGELHRLVAETLNDLSITHAAADNLSLAGALGRKALALREAALGDEHPEVGVSLFTLSSQYLRVAMYMKAEPVARRGHEVLEKALPQDHELNIRMAERVATVCLANYELEEAESLHRTALEKAERRWGKDHPNVVPNLVGLGSVFVRKSDWSNAEHYLKRALKLMERAAQIDPSREYMLLQNLEYCYLFQLKVGDAIGLMPAHSRARYTSNYSSMIDLIKSVVEFVGQQLEALSDRGNK